MSEPPSRRILSGALLVAAATTALAPALASAQSWRTVTMSRQHTGDGAFEVEVDYGAGRFRLRPAEEGVLYRMYLRYDEEAFEPVAEYEPGHLRLGVEGLERTVRIGEGEGELDLALATGVPMDLDLDFGAVRADLDLGGLSLTGLELSTGASETRVDMSRPNPEKLDRARMQVGAADFTARRLGNLNAERIEVDAGVGDLTLEFTGRWQRDARVEVDIGLGALELRFPRGLGVKIDRSTFLTGFDSEGLIKRGDAYYSTDWDEAERKVEVHVSAAFGSIRVSWLR